MGDSLVMTRGRHTKDEELIVSDVEVSTLPQATEPTTEPPGGDGSDSEENGDDVKWQGGPDDPDPGTGGGRGSGS